MHRSPEEMMNMIRDKTLRWAAWYATATLSACAPPADDSARLAGDGAQALHVGAGQVPGAPLREAPEGVSFGNAVTLRGTGCSPTDALPLVREDGRAVTVYFEKFSVELLDREPDKSADCLLEYDVQVPPGYTYAVTQFFYNLQAEVPQGVRSTLSVSYGFEGERHPAAAQLLLPANRLDEPVRPHGVKHVITEQEWAPCTAPRKLQAKVRIALVNSTPRQFAKLDLIQIDGRTNRDGDDALELELAWAKCPEQPAASAP